MPWDEAWELSPDPYYENNAIKFSAPNTGRRLFRGYDGVTFREGIDGGDPSESLFSINFNGRYDTLLSTEFALDFSNGITISRSIIFDPFEEVNGKWWNFDSNMVLLNPTITKDCDEVTEETFEASPHAVFDGVSDNLPDLNIGRCTE